jgi:hypothetical protein
MRSGAGGGSYERGGGGERRTRTNWGRAGRCSGERRRERGWAVPGDTGEAMRIVVL